MSEYPLYPELSEEGKKKLITRKLNENFNVNLLKKTNEEYYYLYRSDLIPKMRYITGFNVIEVVCEVSSFRIFDDDVDIVEYNNIKLCIDGRYYDFSSDDDSIWLNKDFAVNKDMAAYSVNELIEIKKKRETHLNQLHDQNKQ